MALTRGGSIESDIWDRKSNHDDAFSQHSGMRIQCAAQASRADSALDAGEKNRKREAYPQSRPPANIRFSFTKCPRRTCGRTQGGVQIRRSQMLQHAVATRFQATWRHAIATNQLRRCAFLRVRMNQFDGSCVVKFDLTIRVTALSASDTIR